MKIITLTTCHNRKSKTLTALERLHNQKNTESIEFEHVVVDDGSTDGTYEAIAANYPDVNIIQGNGNLYWSGGMRYGFQKGIRNKNYDYLLLYNDDVDIYLDAVSRIIRSADSVDLTSKPSIIVGSTIDSTSKTSYGGCVKKYWFHPLEFIQTDPPEKDVVEVEVLNMNFCLIPKGTIDLIGFLRPIFQHGGSDYEYGLYLRKKGGQVLLAPEYFGYCNRNEKKGTSKEPGISLYECYRRFLSIKERPPSSTFKYYLEYGGYLWLIWFLIPYVNLLLKKLIKYD